MRRLWRVRGLRRLDEVLAALALVGMALIPLVEILVRPLAGSGVQNAPVIVQHLGLVMAMLGSVAALRHAGVADEFSYVSSAGGAFLEWMEGKDLPGVKALAA